MLKMLLHFPKEVQQHFSLEDFILTAFQYADLPFLRMSKLHK